MVIHVMNDHQINDNCFNEPFAVSPCRSLYWDMHGLIFETSIWLLAGSTRFVCNHCTSSKQVATCAAAISQLCYISSKKLATEVKLHLRWAHTRTPDTRRQNSGNTAWIQWTGVLHNSVSVHCPKANNQYSRILHTQNQSPHSEMLSTLRCTHIWQQTAKTLSKQLDCWECSKAEANLGAELHKAWKTTHAIRVRQVDFYPTGPASGRIKYHLRQFGPQIL